MFFPYEKTSITYDANSFYKKNFKIKVPSKIFEIIDPISLYYDEFAPIKDNTNPLDFFIKREKSNFNRIIANNIQKISKI